MSGNYFVKAIFRLHGKPSTLIHETGTLLVVVVKYIASCSGGKDSLAMTLKLIELNYPLDEVVSYLSDADFQAVINVIYKLKALCERKGIKFTILQSRDTFIYTMCEKSVNKRNGEVQQGYQWCGGTTRWGTTIKLDVIKEHYKSYQNEMIVEYVGIASDERRRINRERSNNKIKLYPLVEWEMTEKDCLDYCYSNGWHWNENGYELYDLLDRVSCKYCKNKNLKELRNIYHCLPELWNELKELQDQFQTPYKNNMTIHDLEARFIAEDSQGSIFDFI